MPASATEDQRSRPSHPALFSHVSAPCCRALLARPDTDVPDAIELAAALAEASAACGADARDEEIPPSSMQARGDALEDMEAALSAPWVAEGARADAFAALRRFWLDQPRPEAVASLMEARARVHDLSPSDVGEERFGTCLLVFEGFSEEQCWPDFERRVAEGSLGGVDDLEAEIVAGWAARFPGATLVEQGWQRGGDPGDADVFYAVFAEGGGGAEG